jgi:F0F1-type ATP synthase assembly protein I
VERVDRHERAELIKGLGDDVAARGFELVGAPVIFAAIGWFLDRWIGTTPLFTIVLALFALAGSAYMLWFKYDEQMKAHEADAVWNRRKGGRA